MTVPPDHFTYVGTAHFYLKNELSPLLLLGYQHLVGCIHQVLDYELEEILHKLVGLASEAAPLRGWRGWDRALLARLFDHTCHGLAGLSPVLYPILRAIKVELKILTCLPRIVVANHLNEFAIARTSFVRYHHAIKGTILRTFSP
jgi:hypothetical protein